VDVHAASVSCTAVLEIIGHRESPQNCRTKTAAT
jgi:hypothetical protein